MFTKTVVATLGLMALKAAAIPYAEVRLCSPLLRSQ